MEAVNEIEQALGRTNLRQAALLTVPWILLQFGIFLTAGFPEIGVGAWLSGCVVAVAVALLAFRYLASCAELGNLLIRQMDADIEYYGDFTWFRQWGDQLELVKKRSPGYLNTLRFNYAALPLALLAFVLEYWMAALLFLPVWLITGILVRTAMVRSVLEREVPTFRPGGWWILLLLTLSIGCWGGLWCASDRMKREFHAAVEGLKAAGDPVSAADLGERYRQDGPNGAELVKALGELPEIPAELAAPALSVPQEEVTPEIYAAMERYVFEHGELMRKLSEIGRLRSARLGYQFEKGFAGGHGLESVVAGYRRLGRLEQLRLLTAANAGNRRQLIESWNAIGNFRRQLSREPAVIYCLVGMALESERIRMLERVANEFGVYSDPEFLAFLGELAVTEGELRANLDFALRGERALFLSVADSGSAGWNFGRRSGLDRIFPGLAWADYRGRLEYLDGMEQLLAAVADPARFSGFETWREGAASYAAMPLGVIGSVVERYVSLVRKLRAARIGLELDRYRRAHGGFPDSLAGLKGLPASVSIDPETGEPIGYRLLPSGGASVGKDGGEGFRLLK